MRALDTSGGVLLYGANAIGSFLGINRRQVYWLTEKNAFPFWKEGKVIVCRRATLAAWVIAREATSKTPVGAA